MHDTTDIQRQKCTTRTHAQNLFLCVCFLHSFFFSPLGDDSEVKAMIAEVDADGDGEIDFDEFITMWSLKAPDAPF